MFAGLHNRRALWTALTTVGVGLALYLPMQVVFDSIEETDWIILGLALVAMAVGVPHRLRLGRAGLGRLGAHRRAAPRSSPAALLFIDQVMQVWPPYFNAPHQRAARSRRSATAPRTWGATSGSQTLDTFTHLLLPTLTLVLISFAAYTRYSRSSMLEVMNQDYIRTARSKGLPERTVVMRHAFRNALIPLATDRADRHHHALGGAVITETVFGWFGMGRLFVRSLGDAEIDPVMAYLADRRRSSRSSPTSSPTSSTRSLDPRIRVDA